MILNKKKKVYKFRFIMYLKFLHEYKKYFKILSFLTVITNRFEMIFLRMKVVFSTLKCTFFVIVIVFYYRHDFDFFPFFSLFILLTSGNFTCFHLLSTSNCLFTFFASNFEQCLLVFYILGKVLMFSCTPF